MAKATRKSSSKAGSKTARKTTSKKTARRPAVKSNLTIWKGVVTKAWQDKEFRERLMQDTGNVLAEHGFKGQKGREYRVVADSKTTKHLILPESARSVRIKPVRGNEPDPGF
jgi:hypothetical protein